MNTIKYIRKIIEVEARLGFMFIPAKAQHCLPTQSNKIRVHCIADKEEIKTLSYNTDYNRIFGLTSWYKDNNIKENTYLDVKIENNEIWISTQNKQKTTRQTSSKTVDSIDISNLSSGAKGNIVEDRIKELILLLGQGMLNVYKPVIDNEGIDLIVLKSGQFHPIFLQVKSRYNAHQSQKLILTISQNFKKNHSYFLVGVSFNPSTMEVEDKILFVPSKNIKQEAGILNDGKYRVNASLKQNSKDKWQDYFVSKQDFVSKLFEKFAIMEEHYK